MMLTRERKYILLAAVILLPLAAFYRFAPSLGGVWPGAETIAVKQKQLRKYRIALQEGDALKSRQDALNRALAKAEAGLLTGGTPALAAVDIQNTVNEIVSATGVDVAFTRPLAIQKKPKDAYLTEISVFIRFTADIDQFKRFLFKVENAPKLFQVSQLRVQTGDRKQPDSFLVEMTITGFMKSNESM